MGIECEALKSLEKKRNDFCNKLTDKMNWKKVLIEVYCQMTKDLLCQMTDEEIGFDQVYRMLKSIGFEKNADEKTLNALRIAKAHAFMFEYLEKEGDEGALSFEFAEYLNLIIEGDKHRINKTKELSNFLGLIDGIMKSRTIDTVTLSAIVHCAVIKMQAFREGNHRTALLVQNFVLLKQCYPAMTMGKEDIDEFKTIFDKGKAKKGNWYLRGCDISPSIRFLFKCLDKTMKELLESIEKALPVADESVKEKKIESGKMAAAGGSGPSLSSPPAEQLRASPTGTDYGPSPMKYEFVPIEEDEIVDKSSTVEEPEAKRMKLTQVDSPPAPAPPPRPYVQFGSLFKEALRDFNKHLLEYPKDLVKKEKIDYAEFLKEWGI